VGSGAGEVACGSFPLGSWRRRVGVNLFWSGGFLLQIWSIRGNNLMPPKKASPYRDNVFAGALFSFFYTLKINVFTKNVVYYLLELSWWWVEGPKREQTRIYTFYAFYACVKIQNKMNGCIAWIRMK
jgi:hypothetical protein